MARIWLVRHGETDWNRSGLLQGQTDTTLSETGRAQARALGIRLADQAFNAVYSSDLVRCVETATIVVGDRKIPVQTDPELREVHLGRWQGLSFQQARQQWPEEYARVDADPLSHAPAGGENRRELRDRMVRAARRIAGKHSGEDVLVVSHGGAMRALLTWVVMADLRASRLIEIDNTGICRFDFYDFGPVLIGWNDVNHIQKVHDEADEADEASEFKLYA